MSTCRLIRFYPLRAAGWILACALLLPAGADARDQRPRGELNSEQLYEEARNALHRADWRLASHLLSALLWQSYDALDPNFRWKVGSLLAEAENNYKSEILMLAMANCEPPTAGSDSKSDDLQGVPARSKVTSRQRQATPLILPKLKYAQGRQPQGAAPPCTSEKAALHSTRQEVVRLQQQLDRSATESKASCARQTDQLAKKLAAASTLGKEEFSRDSCSGLVTVVGHDFWQSSVEVAALINESDVHTLEAQRKALESRIGELASAIAQTDLSPGVRLKRSARKSRRQQLRRLRQEQKDLEGRHEGLSRDITAACGKRIQALEELTENRIRVIEKRLADVKKQSR
ncbi:MAG: hypothetical protein AAF481_08135 [Acidobacteriota bacterium]